MYDQRYVVFRKDEFEAAQRKGAVPGPLQDAIVIRQRDQFAAATLQAYTDAVLNAIEILQTVGAEVPESLPEIADWALAITAEAREAHRHLPDL